MSKYDLYQKHITGLEEESLAPETVESMWQIFVAICQYWKNVAQPESMRTRFLAFLSNRIELDASYVSEYRNAAAVIAELIQEKGNPEAYEFLLTNPAAGNSPPNTPLQSARQRVSNEFVALQISLGGFRDFAGATNYPGYISGVNGNGPAPYRTYPQP